MLLLPTMLAFVLHTVLQLSLSARAAQASPISFESALSTCRCFPGDPCWPSTEDWITFNKTLGGKLIATTPIAAVCHYDPFEHYSNESCDALRENWFYPETHLESSSSAMSPLFSNNSCNPFLDPSTACTLGNYVRFSVNASNLTDYQATMAFVQKHDLRLVIRNTGHDYNGKSTGAGALAIWTHHLKFMEMQDYQSSSYTGKALKIGAGVEVKEAYAFSDSHGLVVVGGNCPTVALAGGYMQGGGHGPLASKFGLAADQVLEWEVVTATGSHLIATPEQNADLYWALSGGGGSTYAAVLAATVRAYPTMKTAAANISFANTGTDAFYDVVHTFLSSLPAMVDEGIVVIWFLTPAGFSVMPATAPDVTKARLDELFRPTLYGLNSSNISYAYYSREFPTYLASYEAMNTPWNVSDALVGGRLIPRSLAEDNSAALTTAIRNMIEAGTYLSGVTVNVNRSVSSPDQIGANPYWRQALFDAVAGLPFDYSDWTANLAAQDKITNELLPYLEVLTPNGGAYLNEADCQQPDWQSVFYGDHYNRLNAIKAKYDPDDRMYALQAVGSDRWTVGQDGRLCRS